MRYLEFAQGKTLSRGFFDEYSFKQLRRETRGQWQKCYGKAFMSIYLIIIIIIMLGPEASRFIKHLSERLSYKWERNYSTVMSWVRTRITFAIIRASVLCLRGSRTKWRSMEMADGSPLSLIMS